MRSQGYETLPPPHTNKQTHSTQYITLPTHYRMGLFCSGILPKCSVMWYLKVPYRDMAHHKELPHTRQWWRTPLIPALEGQRQADLSEFEASLVYRGSSRTKKPKIHKWKIIKVGLCCAYVWQYENEVEALAAVCNWNCGAQNRCDKAAKKLHLKLSAGKFLGFAVADLF